MVFHIFVRDRTESFLIYLHSQAILQYSPEKVKEVMVVI